jgi:hypothetical protein
MSCTGVGPFTWYLYNENWNLIDCVDNNQSSYSFTGITTAGTYNVVVVNDSYSATTQFIITGNESCCWDTTLYQPCNEGCNQNGDGINLIKNGDDFQLAVNNNSGAIEIFFKKINDFLGFNSTRNINSNPLDISVLYSSDVNKGYDVYFESLLRSYECCSIEPDTEILFTTPCINDPIYKLLKICNTCDEPHQITGYTFSYCSDFGCPDGYTSDPDGLTCTQIITTGVTYPSSFYTASTAGASTAWGWGGANFYSPLNTLNTPLVNSGTSTTYPIIDSLGNIVSPITNVSNAFWGQFGLAYGRMNNGASIWTTITPNPYNKWVGFSACVYAPSTKTYYLGISADNQFKISINGEILVELLYDNVRNFSLWHVFPIILNSGINIIEMEGLSSGGVSGFGAEIYSASTLDQLTAATNTIDAGLMWSTMSQTGSTFDLGEEFGYTCPNGFVYTNCDGTPTCSQINKIISSGATQCVDNWNLRFLYYDLDCNVRSLVEFDPYTDNIVFSGDCDNRYPYPECKCFYAAIGYRSDGIDDHYNKLNLHLTDNTSTGLKTLSYDLHGRSSIIYTGGRTFNLLTQKFTDSSLPIEPDCPELPSCSCLNISTTTTDNDGYPINSGGQAVYQFTSTYTFTNRCYTEFLLKYSGLTSNEYSGLTIDYSNFDGVLGKNESATLVLNYLSQSLTPIYGTVQYSAYTHDPFLCVGGDIDCSNYLSFQFTPKSPDINISDNNYNFGGVGGGCCNTHTFKVQNIGEVGLTITGVELTNPNFTITNPAMPFTSSLFLNPLNTFDVTIQFCSLTGCTDGTIDTTDIILYTTEYGNISGSTLDNTFSISASCVNPSISGSPQSLVFIKTIDQQSLSALTICNRTNVLQTVKISNCIQLQTGTTETVDPLDHGFEIIVETETTSSIVFPRSINIPPNDCVDIDVRYDTPYPDKIFCSIYLEDNCSNLYEIPFTGYSLPLPINITTYSYNNPVCNGETNGSASISFSGGVAPYTYIFSGDSVYQTGTIYTTSISFSNLPATDLGTDYIFSVSGDPCNGSLGVPDLSPFITPGSPETVLSSPLIFTLIQPSYFEVTRTAYTGLTCLMSGAASVTVTGGTTPYEFEWINGVIETGSTSGYTSIITDLTAGVYSVVARDRNGCQRIVSVDIPDLLPITIVPQIIDATYYGGTDGRINLTVYDAVDPVNYYWSGLTYGGYDVYPTHTDTFSATTSNTLSAGTYYISYVDANSCSGSTELKVYQPDYLDFDVTYNNIRCSYLTNGSIDFGNITGGTQPYSIYASGGSYSYSSTTSTTLDNLDAGTYSAYVIDGNGHQSLFRTVTITKPSPLTLTYSYTATTCIDSSDGMLEINVVGGTPPYSYLWTNSNSTTNYVTGATYGNYYVTVFDYNGCEFSTGFTISFNSTYCNNLIVYDENHIPLPIIDQSYIIGFPYTCYSTSDEMILNFYQDSPCRFKIIGYSGLTTSINDFYLGSEILGTIIPSSGSTNISFVFNPTSPTTYNTTFTAITEYCNYEFILSGTGVGSLISGDTQYLDFGDVCYGTATTRNLSITNLTPDDRIISIQTTLSEFSTPNTTLMLSGNTTETIPYTFTPSYGPTTPVLWEKEFTGTTKLTNCPTLEIYLSGTGYGGNLYVTPLDYGCVNQNCYSDKTVTVYNYHCLPVDILSASIPSFYSPYLKILTFSATTVAPGGTMSFDVRYSALTSLTTYINVGTNFSLASVLMSGITACMVNTLNNVSSPGLMTTIPGVPVTSNVSVENISTTTLFINANITNMGGGTPTDISVFPPMMVLPAPVLPITSTTSNFVLTFNNVNPVNTVYYLNLSDNCGNHVSLPFHVYSQGIGYTYSTVLNPSCYGNFDGYINITPTGGTAPYTVVWGIGVTGNTISGLSADTYNVTITDSNTNSNSFSFTLSDPDPLGLSYTIPSGGYYNILVYGYNTGYVDLTVTGGTLPYTYNWSGYTYNGNTFSSTSEDLTGLYAGNYIITVTDYNGCSISDLITLIQPNPIIIDIENCIPPVPPAPDCNVTGDTLYISVSGGECPYDVIVCPTTPQNPFFSPGGPFYGYITCQILPHCSGATTSGITCVESTCYCCDGHLTPCLSATCPCVTCDMVINNLIPGTYPSGTFGVIDINDGTTYYSGGTWVPNLSTLGFNLSQIAATCNVICDGSIDATIVLTQNQLGEWGMGTPPYTYYLNGSQYGLPTTSINQSFTGLCPNVYTITVIDAGSNSVSHQITVTQGRVTANISTTSETNQDGNGTITINNIIGGIGPYTASLNSWAPVVVTNGYVFQNLSSGNYTIEIVDSIGCRYTVKTRVTRTIPLEAGKQIFGKKSATETGNQTIYEKRLGGFKLVDKIPIKKNR